MVKGKEFSLDIASDEELSDCGYSSLEEFWHFYTRNILSFI